MHRNMLTHPDCDDRVLTEATRVWGGPLPGRPETIKRDPLKCEMVGRPPDFLLEAAGVSRNDPELCRHWTLHVSTRIAWIHHNKWTEVVLPELPAGLVLCGIDNECGMKDARAWDNPSSLLLRKIYAKETVIGAIEKKWPELHPEADRAGFDDFIHGLTFTPDLTMIRIETYGYLKRKLYPGSVAQIDRRRRAILLSRGSA